MPTGRAYGNQISKLCEAFADYGVPTELVYLGKKNQNTPEFFDYFSVKNNFALRPVASFNFLKFESYVGKLGFYMQRLAFLAQLVFLKADSNSVVYTRQPAVAWIMSLRGFPTYYEDHGTTDKKSFILLNLLGRVKGIVVINSFIKKEFVQSGIPSDKVLVAPSGVDVKNFDIAISQGEAINRLDLRNKLNVDFENKKVLVYTGNFRTKGVDKGIDEILGALSVLKDPTLVFIAVGGSEPEIDFYSKMARGYSIKNAFFLPRHNQIELALFQKTADVLLMPFPRKAHYEYFMSPVTQQKRTSPDRCRSC